MKILPVVSVHLSQSKDSNEPPEWHFLMEHASFQHNYAPEFMMYVGGDDLEESEEGFIHKLSLMKDMNCSEHFIASCKDARKLGAVWVQFHW